MAGKDLVVGLDLGGTHAYAGVVNLNGEVLVKKETDIDRNETPEVIIRKNIIPLIKDAMEENDSLTGNIKAVGMGIPGNLDSRKGICNFSPNFGWRNVNITAPIQEALGIPVFIQNDVKTAALGEKRFGAGRGIANFVMCAIGTGIGGGIVIENQLLLGALEAAGEIGHITVEPEGHVCGCGNRGCMEAMASAPNIARRGREEMLKNRNSILWNMVKDESELSSLTLYNAAKEGDATALKVWEDTGRYLGLGFAAIVHIVNPQRIILGGMVANAMEFFMPALRKELNTRARMVPPDSTEIVHAVLKENAGMIGSAAVAMERAGIS